MAFTVSEIYCLASGTAGSIADGQTLTGSTSGATAVILGTPAAPTEEQWNGGVYALKIFFTTAHALDATLFQDGEAFTTSGGGSGTLAFVAGKITVTGTETDLVGVASVCNYIDTIAMADYYLHNFKNFQLDNPAGVLDINSATDEQAIWGNNSPRNDFANAGTLTLGAQYTDQGGVYYKKGTTLTFTNDLSNGENQFTIDDAAFVNTGTLNWYGVNITSKSSLFLQGTYTLRDVSQTVLGGGAPRMDFSGDSADIDGFQLNGAVANGTRGITFRPITSVIQIKNLLVEDAAVAILINGYQVNVPPLTLTDIKDQSQFNTSVWGQFTRNSFIFDDYENLTHIDRTLIDRSDVTQGYGSACMRKSVNWDPVTLAGAAIPNDLKINMTDVDNGTMPTAAELAHWTHGVWTSFGLDAQISTNWGDGFSSYATVQKIPYAFLWYNDTGTTDPFNPLYYTRQNLRTNENNETTASITAQLVSHKYSSVLLPVDMTGNGTRTVRPTMLIDEQVTEQDAATVAAYTELETAAKIKDGLSVFAFDNQLLKQNIGDRVGTTMVFVGHDVVLDSAAGANFNYDGSTVTVKANSYGESLQTTGAVNITGAATCEGITVTDVESFTTATTPAVATVENSTQGYRIVTTGLHDLSTWTFTDNTADFTVDASTPAGTVTIVTGFRPTLVLVDNSGPSTTVVRDDTLTVSVTAPNIIDGSRVMLRNETQDTELDNSVVSGGAGYSTSVVFPTNANPGDTLSLTTTYQSGVTAKLATQAEAVVTISGATFTSTQQDDTVYNELAIDGSTVTEFSGDYANLQIDVSDPDGVTSIPRLYAWHIANLTTADGIRNYVGAIVADDAFNYRVASAVVDLTVQNVSVDPVLIVGGRMYKDDGTSYLAAGGPIQADPDKVYVANIDAIPGLVWEENPADHQNVGTMGQQAFLTFANAGDAAL